MNRGASYYKKALKKYHHGNIDAALDFCELSISESLKNKPSINLKGLLYYFKGDLESSKALWKLNYEINKDEVAQKYLECSDGDDLLLQYFAAAVILIKDVKISEALELLRECEKSNFNCINVNNYIALCLIKLGDFENACIYLDKVFSLEKNNSMAKDSKKMLVETGTVEKKTNYALIALVLVTLSIIGVGLYVYVPKVVKANRLRQEVLKEQNSKKQNQKQEQTEVSKLPETPAAPEFPASRLKMEYEAQDFEGMYKDYSEWKDKDLSENDKFLMSQVDGLLKAKGAPYFYNKGNQAAKNNDYLNEKENYLKVYNLGSDAMYYADSLYFLGRISVNLGDVQSAEKYYEEYDSKFTGGSYEETVLYNLSTLYENMDKNKAKSFAKKLVKNYPKSIYNNSNVKAILSD